MDAFVISRAIRSVCAPLRPSLASARLFSSSARVPAGFRPKPSTTDTSASNTITYFNRVTDAHVASGLGSVIPPGSVGDFQNLSQQEWEPDTRHHIHIYAHKHNTHITLTKPNRDALISVSCGNIKFRKAQRGTYDAAYQLGAFVMSRIKDKGWLRDIKEIELVYRGFGAGREAVTKAILGSEGRHIRPLITKLSDSTRLKFGGTRSRKPRRLG